MNLRPYFSQEVKLTDIDGKFWFGYAKTYTPAIDNEAGTEEIALLVNGELIAFQESEIAVIEKA